MTSNAPSFRYEVRSARHLGELAAALLPLPVSVAEARRSQHRDLYLDTPDDALRSRDIVCRLRLRADDTRTLSIRIGGDGSGPARRFDSKVKSADVAEALSEPTEAGRRLSGIVDPKLLVVRLEIETERLTRTADHDWLGRARLELHYDCSVARRNSSSASLFHVCMHGVRGDGSTARSLALAMAEAHHLKAVSDGLRDRAELLLKWKGASSDAHVASRGDGITQQRYGSADKAEFLNPELSLLAFQGRVLSLAENERTPLAERLRFLGIVSSNIDEFFMIRMAGLKKAAREQSEEQCDDGLTRSEQLHLISDYVAELTDRQSDCAQKCLEDLERHGIRILAWNELSDGERTALRAECREQIHPSLTPMAMTLSPGHPLPHLPHLTLALAVVKRDHATRRLHLAELELPTDSPRFMTVPGRDGNYITLEEVVRSNIDLVYPGGEVENVYAFRVTRGGELDIDEDSGEDLIDAVDSANKRRSLNPAVRVEVEHTMPEFVRDLLLTNLRREDKSDSMHLDVNDIHETRGMLDLRCLGDIDIPHVSGLRYQEFEPADPMKLEASMLDAIRERDLFFHHPFEAFDSTVVRFLREAADDPEVTTIKITLYRIGNSSGIAEALIDAARGGKKVVAFVELQARFDEGHNIGWARKLEKAGGHVVSGLSGYKNHAKAALVVRRENGRLKTYAHVGTGNYNSRSGREYTDLSLFSSGDSLTGDIADFFNALTGGSLPPLGLSRGALIAPHQMKDALIALIEREASCARDGKAARITAKMNGLSDAAVIRALVDASAAGVQVDLVCRGICTLKPGVRRASENIRVVSIVGRFLEHSRIYRFENQGRPQYFIGSADLRPRNLRRRVELLVPVADLGHHAVLQRILDLYVNDATAWELRPDGTYVQRLAEAPGAQEQLMSYSSAQRESVANGQSN